jgi:hypothetical protein
MDLEVAFAVPWNVLHPVLDGLNTTAKPDDGIAYWHIHLTEAQPGKLAIILPKRDTVMHLAEYALPLTISK